MSILSKILYNIPPGRLRESLLNLAYGKSIQETELLLELFRDLPDPRVLIDVGAHYGEILEPFAQAGWRVVAFEPDPANRQRLTALGRQYPQLSIDERAVADEIKTNVPFFTSEESTGISSLQSFRETHQATTTIDVTTLAAALPGYQLPTVTVLKTDAEGFDLPALRGYDWTGSAKPLGIVAEYEDNKTIPLGYTLRDLTAFLENLGYRCLVSEWRPIVRYGQRHRWRRFLFTDADADPQSWGNVVAVRPEWFGALLKLSKKI